MGRTTSAQRGAERVSHPGPGVGQERGTFSVCSIGPVSGSAGEHLPSAAVLPKAGQAAPALPAALPAVLPAPQGHHHHLPSCRERGHVRPFSAGASSE